MIAGYRLDNMEKLVQVKTDNSSRRQVNITLLIVCIKEEETYNDLTVTAYEIGKYHTAEGFEDCIDTTIEKTGT